MNYRKIIILPALFILSNLFYIGCCKCYDSGNSFYEINNLYVQAQGSGNAVVDTGAVTHVDSILFIYDVIGKCVASKKNPFGFIVNSAYACKCAECGNGGLKLKVASIDITSDSVYNGIPANNSLKSLFKAAFSYNEYITIDSLETWVNSNHAYSFRLLTTTKPTNNFGHVFKLKMVFTDGHEVSVSTKRIYWN